MTRSTAAALNDLNRRFYAEQAASFSSTRRGSWAGWSRALDVAGIVHAPSTVVDVACGNMRFESYLAERFVSEPFSAIGVDNCPDLVAANDASNVKALLADAATRTVSNSETSQACVGAPLVAPARLQDTSDDHGLQVCVGAEPAQPGGFPLRAANSRVAASCNPAGGPGSAPMYACESSTDDTPQVHVGVESAQPARLHHLAAKNDSAGDDFPREAASVAGPTILSDDTASDVILSEERSAESRNLVGENAGPQVSASFLNRDLVDLLLNNCPLDLPAGDLVVCFGFMHHVPGAANRRRMLAELLASVAPGGVLVVSFWQFMTASSIAAQATALTEPALADLGLAAGDIEPGDYILGWQNSPTARRYCHNFTLDEIRSLTHDALEDVGSAASFTVTFFEADGRNSRLNCYLVAKRL